MGYRPREGPPRSPPLRLPPPCSTRCRPRRPPAPHPPRPVGRPAPRVLGKACPGRNRPSSPWPGSRRPLPPPAAAPRAPHRSPTWRERPASRVLFGVPVGPQQPLDQITGAEAGRPVDVRHRHGVPGLPEDLPPRHHMEVVGVGEGAVPIEDRRACRGLPLPRLRNSRSPDVCLVRDVDSRFLGRRGTAVDAHALGEDVVLPSGRVVRRAPEGVREGSSPLPAGCPDRLRRARLRACPVPLSSGRRPALGVDGRSSAFAGCQCPRALRSCSLFMEERPSMFFFLASS